MSFAAGDRSRKETREICDRWFAPVDHRQAGCTAEQLDVVPGVLARPRPAKWLESTAYDARKSAHGLFRFLLWPTHKKLSLLIARTLGPYTRHAAMSTSGRLLKRGE